MVRLRGSFWKEKRLRGGGDFGHEGDCGVGHIWQVRRLRGVILSEEIEGGHSGR